MTTPSLKRVFGVVDFALFNVAVVFSIRGLATAAIMGPVSLLLWVLATLTFFVPLALAVMELSSRDPGEGGFYRWVRDAFGESSGFVAGWFYWLSNLTYLPSLLIFLAGNAVYVGGWTGAGEDPWFIVPFTLVILWIATWLNVRGFSLGRHVTNLGGIAAPLAALLLLAAAAVAFGRYGATTSLGPSAWHLPDRLSTLGYFATLSFAFAGFELSTLMGGEVRDPSRTIPRAIMLSAGGIALLYVLGTAAILVALPASDVSPISGMLGAIQAIADRAGWPFLPPLVAILVTFAAFAGFTAWLGGMARLPYAVGLDRFLPAALAELHPRHGTPYKAILLQSVLTTVFIVASQAGATVREAYLLLLLSAVILTFIPYLFLFAALPRLRPREDEPGVVRVPGGRGILWLVAGAGLLATLLTLVSAAVPTPDVRNPILYEVKLWGGLAVFGVVGLLLFRTYRRRAAR